MKHLSKAIAFTLTAALTTSSLPLMMQINSAPAKAASGTYNDAPGDIPSGSSDVPSMPSGSGAPSSPQDSSSSSSITLSGAYTADGTTATYDGTNDSTGLISTSSDQNVVLATNGGSYTLTNALLNKTGDCSSADNSNFYAVNAILAATASSSAYISDSTLTSASEGSNGIFATGSNATIYAKNDTINTTSNSSRGLDATYEGTIVGYDLNITTTGAHCGAIATDRGGGYISVDTAVLNTAGQGSPLIYSTGTIEVNNVTGEATGAQIVGMEGLNTVRIKNSTLTGSATKASEPVANGVILYQSTSGDSSTGTADFEASDSTLKSYVSGGAMFYITNTDAQITLSNTTLDYDSDNNTLITAGGNDGSNGWGSAGSNGGNVTLTAIDQTLAGDVSCDGISYVSMYLTDTSSYTGSIVNDTTYTGNGGVSVNMDSTSKWIVTNDCTLSSLSQPTGATITDANGNNVNIVSTSGNTLVSGDSNITITVGTYSTDSNISGAQSVSAFTADRTAFNSYYSTTDSTSATDSSTSSDNNSDTDNSSSSDSSVSVSTPAAVKITKLTSTKHTITCKWKKGSNITGYVLYRSTSKKGTYKKAAILYGNKQTAYKDTKLKVNKKYYYKIQTFKTTSDTTLYSSKSKAASIKTKKK